MSESEQSTDSKLQKTIGVLNQKGGAGKTTTTIHVAGALGNRGYDVLAMDMDPSGSLSKSLGFKDYYNDLDNELTLHEVLTNPQHIKQLDNVIQSHEEFDVVPAHKRMINESINDTIRKGPRSEERLRLALNGLDREYDFVIVDCEPAVDPLTNNAMFLDGLIVPTRAESLNLDGLELLNDQIEDVQGYHPELNVRLLAIVLTDVGDNGEVTRIKSKLEESFPSLPQFTIRHRVALQRASSESRSSIYAHSETIDWSPGDSYDDIVDAIEERFDIKTPEPIHQ